MVDFEFASCAVAKAFGPGLGRLAVRQWGVMPPGGACLAALLVAACLVGPVSAGALGSNLAHPIYVRSGLRSENHSDGGGGDMLHGAGPVPTPGGAGLSNGRGAEGLLAAVGGRDATTDGLRRRRRYSSSGGPSLAPVARKRRGTYYAGKNGTYARARAAQPGVALCCGGGCAMTLCRHGACPGHPANLPFRRAVRADRQALMVLSIDTTCHCTRTAHHEVASLCRTEAGWAHCPPHARSAPAAA